MSRTCLSYAHVCTIHNVLSKTCKAQNTADKNDAKVPMTPEIILCGLMRKNYNVFENMNPVISGIRIPQ